MIAGFLKNIAAWLLMLSMVGTLHFSSCSDGEFGEINTGASQFRHGDGVFIINEGNFGNGNGSVSFFNIDSLEIYNEIFYTANNRPPGDVPFSMTLIDDEAWLVVNNSARVEVLDMTDMTSVAVIDGLTSPRFLLPVNGHKAYVSDLYSPEVSIIGLVSKQPEGAISIGRSSEQMVMAGGLVFAASWSGYGFPSIENNMLMVIDPETDMVVDSVIVGKEPNSMVVDHQGLLWVLCSGGFTGEELPTLWRIHPQTLQTEAVFTFSDIHSSPTSLCLNGNRDTLFYLNRGVFRMPVAGQYLPADPWIAEGERLFYALGVHPVTSSVFVSDAIDYQQRGMIYYYDHNGVLLGSYRAGIIPGRFVFNQVAR
jgi:YVTN family beta-propeller protein